MLHFKTGKELKNLPETELKDISDLFNQQWGTLITVTPELVQNRFDSEQLFLVGYDQNNTVASVLETMLIHNDSILIPSTATYNELTVKGTWQPHPYTTGKYKILVLVDISAKGKGAGAETIDFAKRYIALETNIDNVLTFTPDIAKVRNWHLQQGARATENRVVLARPGYNPGKNLLPEDCPEDVLATSYIAEIERNRNNFLIKN
ncbi:MAG: hypothetical protein AABW48_04735 [Nanoarchaeota archaeon]